MLCLTKVFQGCGALIIIIFLNQTFAQSIDLNSTSIYGNYSIDSINITYSKNQLLTLPPPKLIYPANNATNIPIIPDLKIGTIPDADRYEVQLSTDRFFFWSVISYSYWQFEEPVDQTELVFVPGIRSVNDYENGKKYYWRARAMANNQTETSPWSEVFEYETTNTTDPLITPFIILPQMNSTNTWVELMFDWTEIANSTRYQIQVSDNSSFNSFYYHFPEINSQQFNLKPQFEYYCRVVAYNSYSLSSFSDQITFYTDNYTVLTKDKYIFTDGSGFDNYENNLDVHWLIKPENGKRITFDLVELETEFDRDFINIYDGETTDSPLIGSFSGNEITNTIISSGNKLLVEFKTNWAIKKTGWKATYFTGDEGWQWPVIAPCVTQDFATYGSFKANQFHNGIDMTSSLQKRIGSTEIFAAFDGVVFLASDDCDTTTYEKCNSGFGNFIVLKHSDDFFTLYAHLHSIEVKKDSLVKKGDKIGIMGRTGQSDYPFHLHFELLNYPPSGSIDFDSGYSINFPDINKRYDPKTKFRHKTVRVNTDKLNVRRAPSSDSAFVTTITKDQYYVALDEYKNWFFINLPYATIPTPDQSYLDLDRYGWVSGEFLEEVFSSDFEIITIDGQQLWENDNKTWLTVYSDPSVSSVALTKVWPGQRYVVIDYYDSWVKINLTSNTTKSEGWFNLAEITNIHTSNNSKQYFYSLDQNYPNPFNPTTVIIYSIPFSQHVNLKVYDILGREMKTLVNDFKNAGQHEIEFDASQLTSGVYMYRIKSGEFISTKKMLLLR